MPIKYAARGISTQFRTPSELVEIDGVTLKPVNGGEVFLYNIDTNTIVRGEDYRADTGGAGSFEDIGELNSNDLYTVSDVVPAWYVGSSVPASVPVKSNVGVADVWEDS